MSARFRKSELARVALAMREGGVDSYEVTFDDDGKPIVRVGGKQAANDSNQALLDELNAWERQQGAA